MADHSQTVSNTLVVLGMSPCNVWGTLEWGADNWGPTLDVITEVEKGISNATSLASSTQRDVVWDFTVSNTLDIEDGLGKEIDIVFSGTITGTSTLPEILRSIGVYDYVASRPTTNWADQVIDVSSKVADPTDDSTVVTNPNTTWSEV